MDTIGKHARITGEDRAKLTTDITARYSQGASIRALAEEFGRSYGFIHYIVAASEASMRPRGGSRPGHRNAARTS